MRVLAPLLLLIVPSCASVENSFIVSDDAKVVESATLKLCGRDTPLRRTDRRFDARQAINCEGSGSIRLRYASGDEHDCTIGYVTPGGDQSFKFRATPTGCVATTTVS
jgi:hypothetical protein